ncbi:MAG: hypothetical protein JOZ90_05160 [Alphaproteobacteria bacterium]|nr:hypothetical protein [Alphaproteobacteria bacterium]MBV9372835.1 hypothetical protein [Alphaproteobacteria bacterium]MBV9900470.1 hypothetical protein [Alphaproteobacteria bacterium]
MAISPTQAAAALDEIEATEQRTRAAGGYAIASPYLILWGVLWTIGYAGCAFAPPARWGLVWLPLVLIGAGGSAWLGGRAPKGRRGEGGALARSMAMAAAIGAFIGAVYYVFRPAGTLPYLVFPALIVGLVYTLAGTVARLPRFAWIGVAIFVLTMAGYVALPDWMALWTAAVAGGGLVLGGLWLRRV